MADAVRQWAQPGRHMTGQTPTRGPHARHDSTWRLRLPGSRRARRRGTVAPVKRLIMFGLVWAQISTVGCDGSPATGTDGAIDSPIVDSPIDAAVRCAPATPWGTPRLVLSLNTSDNEIFGRLTADELTLFGRVADTALTVSTRTSRSDTFPIGTPLDLGQSTMNFSSPTVTGDGLTLYFLAGVGTDPRIWRARRTSLTSPFTGVGPVAELASVANAGSIYVLPDESALYISYGTFSTQPIQRAAHTGGAFAAPVDLVDIVGISPTVSPDELTILFSTRTASSNGVWMGTRPSTSDAFGSLAQVPVLDSPTIDDPSWLSPDNCRLYLRSDRPGGSGGFDLYISERNP